MLEMNITITAADLAAAINSLAAAIDNSGALNIGATPVQQAPVAPENHTVPAAPGNEAPVVPTAPAQPEAPAVPTSAPQYTLEMISAAGAALIDAGKLDQLMALLSRFGTDTLINLPPENYGAVARELRALGARI